MYSMISTTSKIIFIEEDWKGIYPTIKSDHFGMVRLCKRVLLPCVNSPLFLMSSTKRYDISV